MSAQDPEKHDLDYDIKHVEQSGEDEVMRRPSGRRTSQARIDAFTPEQQKNILWRIDRRLTVTLGFMYCISLIDRTNLSNAAVAGMLTDLDLTGEHYSISVLLFFISYIILQPPATVLLRRFGPRVFLPTITVLWGVTMIIMGFIKTWKALAGLRVVLGVFEAGFFPGCAYLLSCWYLRYELQKRNAVFYLIGVVASAFSGILAYGLMQLNERGSGSGLGLHYGPTLEDPNAPSGIDPGIAGWRWIFILEGTATCIIGIVGSFFIVDFPENSANPKFAPKFLNEREADFIVAKIEKDRDDAAVEPFELRSYLGNALDLKIWAFGVMFGLTTSISYALAYFLNIILRDGMGFSVTMSLCLAAPPYVAAGIVTFVCAYLGDKYHIRSPFIIFNASLAVIGLPLLGFAKSNGARYFGVFLAASAVTSNVPTILTYQANNIRGQWKRAFCSATLIGLGGVGGIAGGLVFKTEEAPYYHTGMYSCIAFAAGILVIAAILTVYFIGENKKADRGQKVLEGLEDFRYTL